MAIKKLLFKKVGNSFESLPFKAESANGALTLNFKSKNVSCPFSIYWSIDKSHWASLNTGLAQGIGSMLLSNLPKDLWLKISSRYEIFEGLFLDESTSEPEATITVNGTVSPKEASLVFTSSDLGSFKAVIDKEGKYSIDLPEGEYSYSCEAEGYTTQSDTVNSTKQLDLTLVKEKITVSGTITPFTAVLTIIPIAGGDSIKPTISSSDGSYSQQIDKGNYIYTVEAENYVTKKGSLSETKDLTVSLDKAKKLLRGKITPHRAKISFTPIAGGEPSYAYINPADGMFIIELFKESYNYSASTEGYVTSSGEVEPSSEFIEVNLKPETITVSGTLTPASSVITFKSKSGKTFTPEVDSETGTYSQDLPKETYNYSVESEGYITEEGTVNTTKTLDVTLKTSDITITGTVIPFTASLTFTKEGGKPIKAVVSPTDGTYSQVLPRDTYTYNVENSGYISKSGTISETGPLNVTLETSEITVSGTVTPFTSKLVFKAKDSDATFNAVVSSEDGSYSQKLPRGSYSWEASNEGYTTKTGEVEDTSTLNVTLDELITITGTLVPNNSTIKFTKKGGGSPIAASVSPEGAFTQKLDKGEYDYVVEAAGYISQSGTVNSSKDLSVTLKTENITVSGTVTPATASLSFTKKSGGEPVVVSVTPETGAYSQVLPRDVYTYNAENDGYSPKTGEVQETQTLNISLEPVAAPSSAKLDLGGIRK